jgi:hypothetical protein
MCMQPVLKNASTPKKPTGGNALWGGVVRLVGTQAPTQANRVLHSSGGILSGAWGPRKIPLSSFDRPNASQAHSH